MSGNKNRTKKMKKKSQVGSNRSSRKSTISRQTTKSTDKKKKGKQMSKKEREKMRKMEKALKERILVLRKEAEAMLAEFSAMEEAAARKTLTEEAEHKKRVERLTAICHNFQFAKSRLVHEHNKIRDSEIWNRFLSTDQKPYPEVTQNMHLHLYLFQMKKSSNYTEFLIPRSCAMIQTLEALTELIRYPLYESPETLANWKEIRLAWRDELLSKFDKSTFNKIINLEENFDPPVETDLHLVYQVEETAGRQCLGLTVWLHKDNPLFGRVSPKVTYPLMNAEIQLPSKYRKTPFVLRLTKIPMDFLSDSSPCFDLPKGFIMEPDFLSEVQRWFEVKKESKAAVADREREKIRAAKQKVLEAQAAAAEAEKNFESFQMKVPKKVSSALADSQAPVEAADNQVKAKKSGKDGMMKLDAPVDSGKRKPRGVWDDGDRGGLASSIMKSEGTQKTLDSISMKSGMRRKIQERFKKDGDDDDSTSVQANIFHTQSIISISQRRAKVEVKRASEVGFEEFDENMSDTKSLVASKESSIFSFNSLDFMFGDDDSAHLKGLVENVVMVQRGIKPRSATKTSTDFRFVKNRKRGKSVVKRGIDDSEDVPQTASEIFEEREEARQDRYMASLLISNINRVHHINLRAYQSVGGIFLLDLILPELQAHVLPNGDQTQIFCGPLNVKLDPYEYNYVPQVVPVNVDQPDEPPPPDPNLQNLFHIKIPLPNDVIFINPPIVALFDKNLKMWTRTHVHNLNVDLETNQANFLVGKPLPFAFFIKKYSFLPLIKWHVKPNYEFRGVNVTLLTQDVRFDFIVSRFTISLSSIQGVRQESVAGIVGEFMNMNRLVDKMKAIGLNLFPDPDAFLYCSENTAKDPVLEDHIYLAMAMFTDSLEFCSSQWNTDYNRRKISFQVREAARVNVELRYRTVVAGVDSANIYRVSDEDTGPLDETKVEKLGFHPDVYSLLEQSFTHALRSSAVDPILVITVYDLFSRLKFLSYCGFSNKEADSSESETSKKSPKKRGKKSVKSRGKDNYGYKQALDRLSQASISVVSNKTGSDP